MSYENDTMSTESNVPYNKSMLCDKSFAIDHLHDTFLDRRRILTNGNVALTRKMENNYSRKRRMMGHYVIPQELRGSICINQHGYICNATDEDLVDIYTAMYTFSTKRAEEKYTEVLKIFKEEISSAYGIFANAYFNLSESDQEKYKGAFIMMSKIPKDTNTFLCTKQ